MTTNFRATLCAGLALALSGCGSNSSSTTTSAAPTPASASAGGDSAQPTPTEAPKAFVRAVHVVPGGPDVKLQADGQPAGDLVRFGNASDFVAIAPGQKVKITALAASGAKVSGPMPVNLKGGQDLTVVVNGVPGDVALLPFKREGRPAEGQSRISFAHAAKELGAIQIQIDGQSFRRDVDYGEDTEYKTLPAGQHTLTISYSRPSKAAPAPTPTLVPGQISPQPTPAKPRESVTLQQPASLGAGKVYTLVVFYDAARNPKALLLDDRFAKR